MSRSDWLVCLCTVLLSTAATGANTPASDASDTVLTIEQREDIRVVYDIKVDEWTAGVGRGLYYVRGLLEAYKSQGVDPTELHISVVLHGKPVSWALIESSYQAYKDDAFTNNPNEHVIEGLLEHGVSVEACNVTMKSKGWTAADLLSGIRVVHDGYTRLIDLQQRGYAYIRF